MGKAKEKKRDTQEIKWLREDKRKEEGKDQSVLSTWGSIDDSFIVE